MLSAVVILAGLAAGVIGQAVFAMSSGFGLVVVARVLAGVSVGFLWVATYTMAVNWFRDRQETVLKAPQRNRLWKTGQI